MKAADTGLDYKNGIVEMAHGGGGRAMTRLIETLFVARFSNPLLNEMNDQAFLPLADTDNLTGVKPHYVMATDSHVVSPLFFPGGNIGNLSVHGTINDVAMSGATPLYLAASFILEEGFPLADLKRIVESMAEAAIYDNIQIVTGDTKVVERGKGDGVFITTTGFGVVRDGIKRSPHNICVGDKILVSGTLGDHGVAIMSHREHLTFETEILSDTQSLSDLVAAMVAEVPTIRCMRDPTRGGLASVVNEITQQAKVGITLWEKKLPIQPQVKAACELLGLDPLYIANEGKLIAFCPSDSADQLLRCMTNHPKGANAAVIGEVTDDLRHGVQLETEFGGLRRVDWLSGEQLPRIC